MRPKFLQTTKREEKTTLNRAKKVFLTHYKLHDPGKTTLNLAKKGESPQTLIQLKMWKVIKENGEGDLIQPSNDLTSFNNTHKH